MESKSVLYSQRLKIKLRENKSHFKIIKVRRFGRVKCWLFILDNGLEEGDRINFIKYITQ